MQNLQFTDHWLMYRVMALVDTSAECSLVYGKAEQFPSPRAHIVGYGGRMVKIQSVSCDVDLEQGTVKVVSCDV